MPVPLAALVPGVFGAGGALALTTAAGGLTIAGSLVAIGGSFLLDRVLEGLFAPPEVKPENIKLNVKTAVGPRVSHYGRVKVGGTVVFERAHQGTSYRVIVHGHGPVENVLQHYLNNATIIVTAKGFVPSGAYNFPGGNLRNLPGMPGGPYDPGEEGARVAIIQRFGDVPNAVFAQLSGVWNDWTADHRLDELWCSLVMCESTEADDFRTVYPNGLPTHMVEAETTAVLDPRDSLTKYTENAALVINDYVGKADGLNQPGAFEAANIIAEADICDAGEVLAEGGSEPRFRISGSYALNEQPQDVLRRMLNACSGRIRLTPAGKLSLKVGKWRAPTATLTYDQVIKISDYKPGPDKLDRYNSLPARYVDPALDFSEVDATPWIDDARIAADGEELQGQVHALIFCPSHRQARAAMKLKMERDNPAEQFKVLCKPGAVEFLYEDVIEVDLSPLPISGMAELVSYQLQFDNGNLAGVEFDVRIVDPLAFSLAVNEQGENQVLPDENTTEGIPAPTGFAAAGQGVQIAEGGFAAGIAAQWADPGFDQFSRVLRYAPTGTTNFVRVNVEAGATSALIANLANGADYDVELYFEGPEGQKGPSVTVTATATATTTTPPAPTGLTGVSEAAGEATIRFTVADDSAIWKTEVFRDGGLVGTIYGQRGQPVEIIDTPGAGSFDFTARSTNVAGTQNTTDAGPVTVVVS